MSKRMRWDIAAKRAKIGDEHCRAKQITRVPIDQTFWKAWRDDPKAMRAAGYHVRKDRNGRWQAWIEQ
jgi:hypothetical protein